ncbi:MAG TPA: hypothetical protein VJM33_02635 [Microthrixaceae bacterium]|nr:hypothetical protein [Microthrixaceae bacterium]
MNAPTHRGSRRSTRIRLLSLAAGAVMAISATACTPDGTININGPWTVPLPPIMTDNPPQVIPLLGGICNVGYDPPDVAINGATVTVPSIGINPLQGVINVPNVSVNIPAVEVFLPALALSCGGVVFPTAVVLVIPAQAHLQNAQLDLASGVLTLENPTVTITGIGLVLPGIAGLTIPLPPQTLALGTQTFDLY